MGRRRNRKRVLALAPIVPIVAAEHARMVQDNHHAKGRLEVVRSAVIEQAEHTDAKSLSAKVAKSTPFDSTAARRRVIEAGSHELHYHTYTTFNNPLTPQDLLSPYTMVHPNHPNTDADASSRTSDSQSYNWFPLAVAFSIQDAAATNTMFDRIVGSGVIYDNKEVIEMLKIYGPQYHMDKHGDLVGVISSLGQTGGAGGTGFGSSWKFTVKFLDPSTKFLSDPESVFKFDGSAVGVQLVEICPKGGCPTEHVYASYPTDNHGIGGFGAGAEIGYATLGKPINFPWYELHLYYLTQSMPQLPSPEELQVSAQDDYQPRVWNLQRTEDLTTEEKAEAAESKKDFFLCFLHF